MNKSPSQYLSFNKWLQVVNRKIDYLTKGRFCVDDYDKQRLYCLWADYNSAWTAAGIIVGERDPVY